ncbi:MAG: porin [Gammaproteobacteria bacterium SHHR-1]
MRNKLLPLAIASALTSTLASAPLLAQDLTIYGAMHYSLDYLDTDSAAVLDDTDWATGVNRASFIGVKGSEDLGNGLKAIFKIESNINDSVGSFNTYVGLSGDWGTVFMGQHDTPYMIATDSLDLFVDTLADSNVVLGSTALNGSFALTVPQTIAYISPDMNGLTLAGAWVQHLVDEPLGVSDTNAVSLAAMYANGPLFASLAYEDHANGTAIGGAADADAWKLGLGYQANGFTAGLVYEQVDGSGPLTGLEVDNLMLSASYAAGNNVFKVQYGDSDSNRVGGDFDYWAIGLDHSLSQRTKVYALYTALDNGSLGLGALNCADTVSSNDQCVADHDGLSVGIQHSF